MGRGLDGDQRRSRGRARAAGQRAQGRGAGHGPEREHRARGTGVFAPAPPGTPAEAWERRRRHGIATFVRKWETVAAYGPLDAAELRDALWLLAWFESPTRRHEALRWYTGLGERDAPGAAALRADLAKDADARALADYLATARADTSGAHRSSGSRGRDAIDRRPIPVDGVADHRRSVRRQHLRERLPEDRAQLLDGRLAVPEPRGPDVVRLDEPHHPHHHPR